MTVESISKGIEHAQKIKGLIFDTNVVDWDHQIEARRKEIEQAFLTSCRPFSFKRWQRAISYRYSTAPLSCVGSHQSVTGGRFNIGTCDPERFEPFPALYVAEERETAWAEKFGVARKGCGLTTEELALTKRESISYVSVSGEIETVLDLRDPDALVPFFNIVRDFRPPESLVARGKKLKVLVEYPSTLKKLLFVILERHWRAFPTNFDIPSPSQRLGALVYAAGIGGIV